ncbi:nuclease-related domain-containing protein [Chryseobacterium candidae]|uniref:NERD domain-containing protein n=1 Tax=Chryseobacterium candidae TaxID=1978493 RepID=A0ABY2R283_9FLAO|nr:nuclease-related domain-containing protein [Chryseobacterium candidae]THV56431.1 NERD domain-containing protein [Chryseobacterium candidae]
MLNKTPIKEINFRIVLDSVVFAICNLAFDIGKQIYDIDPDQEKIFLKELFKEDFYTEIGLRDSELDQYNEKDIFTEIANHYNSQVLKEENILNEFIESDVLLINKIETFVYSVNDEKNFKTRFIRAVKKFGLLEDIIGNLNDEKIRNSLSKINLFESDTFYKDIIETVDSTIKPQLPFLDIDLLDETKYTKDSIDDKDIWINNSCYSSVFLINEDLINSEDVYLVSDNESNATIGILLQKTLIPYTKIDITDYISNEKMLDFFWQMFLYNYSTKTKISPISASGKELTEFKHKINDGELNKLLSFLKYNLYIKDEKIIPQEFLIFFEKVTLISQLKYIENFEFLVSESKENHTALGIYAKEKIGREYNLIHWLNNNGEDNLSHFRNSQGNRKRKNNIHTLKPEISYYFIENYFEDFFDRILRENDYEFMRNIELESIDFKCEIDFLIKTKNTLYIVETKTKLTKYYIESHIKKISKIINLLKNLTNKKIEIKFLMVSAYSEESVQDFKYFINEHKIYNKKRDGLSSIPYLFDVPIPDKENEILQCISEPEFDKLKSLILEVCPL